MEFLLAHMQNRSRETNVTEDKFDNEQTEEEEVEIENTEEKGENDEDQAEVHRTLTTAPKPKRKKGCDVADLIKASLARQEHRSMERDMHRKRRVEIEKNDELYHFFMSMYETTKRFPIHLQHLVKSKIFGIVSASEAENLNLPFSPCALSQPQPVESLPSTVPTPQTSSSTQFSFESFDYPSTEITPRSTLRQETSDLHDNVSEQVFCLL